MSLANSLGVVLIAAFALDASVTVTPRDRRIVDVAEVGDSRSESDHGFAASDVVSGLYDSKPYRRTTGWMHFAMRTFEDTEVTVSLTFLGIDTPTAPYEVVVEDSILSTGTIPSGLVGQTTVDVAVPFSLTKGKANIAVVIRGRDGLTPALRQVRTIQDHHELDPSQNLTGVTR